MVSWQAFSLRASFVFELLRRPQYLCKMDAFDIQGCQGLNEDTQSVMYFDCFYDLSFTVPSLPFLRLNGVFSNFRFLNSLP